MSPDKNYNIMTVPELEAELQELGHQRDALKDEGKKIAAVINRKLVEEKLAKMTDAEKDALKQALFPKGFAEAEVVKGIG